MATFGKGKTPEVRLPRTKATLRAAAAKPNPGRRGILLASAEFTAEDEASAIAYAYLRAAIGVVALLLPPVIAVGTSIADKGISSSISQSYYGHMRNYFVGSMSALGVFFLSYQRKPLDKYTVDRIVGLLAAGAAFGVAMCPTTEGHGVTASGWTKAVGDAHLAFAFLQFCFLAVFSLKLFVRSDGLMTPQKKTRNKVYKACGYVIVACLAEMVVAHFTGWTGVSMFVPEAIAVEAFALSWLVKGAVFGFLADPPIPAPPPAPPAADAIEAAVAAPGET